MDLRLCKSQNIPVGRNPAGRHGHVATTALRTGSGRAFSLVELLVAIGVISILLALLLPAVMRSREAARRTACANNFRQVGLAMHNYHEAHNVFPPGTNYWVNSCGMPGVYLGWGWGTFLLPHVEHTNLYNRFNFGRNVLHSSNFAVAASVVSVYACPSDLGQNAWVDAYQGRQNGDAKTQDVRATSMCGVADSRDFSCPGDMRFAGADRNGLLFQASSVRTSDVTDGSSQTLFVGEITGSRGTSEDGPGFAQFFWLTDNVQDTADGINGPLTVPGGRNQELDPIDGDGVFPNRYTELHNEIGFSSFHSGGANFVLVDGSVRFLSENISGEVLRDISTRDGGEVIDEF